MPQRFKAICVGQCARLAGPTRRARQLDAAARGQAGRLLQDIARGRIRSVGDAGRGPVRDHHGHQGVSAGDVRIAVKDGEIPAYRAVPADKHGLPTVPVVPEIWGVHEYIKDVCRRFAKEGFLAVAPKLFARHGEASTMRSPRACPRSCRGRTMRRCWPTSMRPQPGRRSMVASQLVSGRPASAGAVASSVSARHTIPIPRRLWPGTATSRPVAHRSKRAYSTLPIGSRRRSSAHMAAPTWAFRSIRWRGCAQRQRRTAIQGRDRGLSRCAARVSCRSPAELPHGGGRRRVEARRGVVPDALRLRACA